MGFDLYGLNPKGDVPKPVITDWKDDSISFEEQMKAYQSYQNDTPGSYFRANVWWWRPLWQYITVACEDILTEKDIESGSYNDGHTYKLAFLYKKFNKGCISSPRIP